MKMKNYYFFWSAITVAVVVPQVVAALAYHKLADVLTEPVQVEIVKPSTLKVGL
tara:strand:- start:253 stop:414 length:162 start_codon:yes stop_codon:yes gene_type:complete